MSPRPSAPAHHAAHVAATSALVLKAGWLRGLCVMLALWLPLQLSWALAASYCGHEAVRPTQAHLGHHAHAHEAGAAGASGTAGAAADASEAGDPADGAAPQDTGSAQDRDADCPVCHTATLGWAPLAAGLSCASSPSSAFGAGAPALSSVPQAPPERPQWLRLV